MLLSKYSSTVNVNKMHIKNKNFYLRDKYFYYFLETLFAVERFYP
jgi:hypothetical protein